ncbi:MAG: selenocysteine-specific translation elongation factor [Chloroflexi bacterium]|nr:selenocysteine-specific translation elongation factor [Chloroflexota bacterium]
MRVIGTAGHVDHGKSSLVLALTGIDPDRLREEKERQMTIDLGFAWLTLPPPADAPAGAPAEQVGVIDVPGHIDFIKNMLAGVGGIDAALFVVAADEGMMPQTREHLAILDLLQVQAGVVALTKTDVVSEEGWLELVEADVHDSLAGTSLANAAIVPVSARTGAGLEELKRILADVLAQAPVRRDRGQPRLPIDRAFSVAGFGTVVTGTLSDGVFRVGDEVEIVPGHLRTRIRTLQTHKRAVERGLPGSRLAINLTGVHPDQLARGMVVGRPGALRTTDLLDVRMRLVADQTGTAAAMRLRHNQMVDFFSGAAEAPARVRLLSAEEIGPGGTGWAQLRLDSAVAVVAGDRFIIRQPSPSLTIGGGQVVNPHPARRWRRFQPQVIAQLETLARGTPEDLLLHALAAGEPGSLKTAVERSGLPAAAAEATLARLIAEGQILPLGVVQPPLAASATLAISLEGWRTLAGRLADILDDYHGQFPLRPGIGREELKSRVQGRERWPPKLFNELVARAASEEIVAETGDYLHRPGFRITFTAEQQTRVDALLAAFRRQPYTPPSMAESAAMADAEIVSALMYAGTLVRLSEDVLFLKETYDEIVSRIVAYIREKGSMTVAQVRDAFNASRKYALAIMEHLDERKITRRVGDERVLR